MLYILGFLWENLRYIINEIYNMINDSKIRDWVEKYFAHVKEITPSVHIDKMEGYKFKAVDVFQKNFDINAKDLARMLDVAILNNNLVTGSWFFPRKMLLIFAKDWPNETRENLRVLFDESRPVGERIDAVEKEFDRLMTIRNTKLKEDSHHFMGTRFLALMLGYRYPLVHNSLKPREWKEFCRFIDDDFFMATGATSGKKYEIYLPYIEALRAYIAGLPQIEELKAKLTEGLEFHDEAFRWMAQDIIYVVAAYAGIKKDDQGHVAEEIVSSEEEDVDDEGKIPATIGNRFTFEEDLEHYVIENLGKLGLGDELKLYLAKDGTVGQQYTIPVGIIDILAVDKAGNFVVIELKRDQAKADVAGQIAGYLQWVQDNLATFGQSVRGVIIATRANNALSSATKALKYPVETKLYQLKLIFENKSE